MTVHDRNSFISTINKADFYYSLLSALPIPVYYLNKDLTYRFANSAYEIWLGVSAGSLQGQSIETVLGAPTVNTMRPYMEAAFSGKRVQFEISGGLYFHRPVFMESSYTPDIREDGEVIGYLALIDDITEKKKIQLELHEKNSQLQAYIDNTALLNVSLEQKVVERTRELEQKNIELRTSEERYHKMIDEVQDYAILMLNKDGFIQNWNKGAEKIKGYSEQEIIGKNFRIFYQDEDRYQKLPEQLIAKAETEGRAYHEGWRVRKDGTKFWGSIVITALHDNIGRVIGFTKVTRDLTERKLAEDKLQQNAIDLMAQNKELEQFAYIASHDLKEPLRKIILYNHHLVELLQGKLNTKEENYLLRSASAAMRMQRLIDDILTYSKTTNTDEQLKTVNLNQLLQEVIHSYDEQEVIEKNILIADSLPVIQGIPFQLTQLFDNLLGNSIKYRSPDRPLKINISCEITQPPIRDVAGAYYKICFTDNGVGFDNAFVNKIFELFQRLFTKEQYDGTGIGLAICKKIMQNHHGYIVAYGEENKGAAFALFFPINSSGQLGQ